MRRAVWWCAIVLLSALALLSALGGCGETKQLRQPDLVMDGAGGGPAATPGTGTSGRGDDALRIAVVTHGQAAHPFWVIVRNGIDAAARQLDASVSYRSPDTYSVPRMRALIEAATAERPDGLVVSIPSRGVEPAIRRAVRAGIPVISMNSGSHRYRRLGVLAHIGQPEDAAGKAAGERLARTGVRRGLCVNHEPGNAGLVLRCRAFIQAMRRSGGDADVLVVDIQNRAATRARLVEAIRSRRLDGVLTLSSQGAEAALDAVRSDRRARRVHLATFDISPAVLEAISDGEMRFAVDQQAYLQGYLPVVLLAQRIRYGIFAGEGMVLPTGPSYVTRDTAGQVVRLSERGIR